MGVKHERESVMNVGSVNVGRREWRSSCIQLEASSALWCAGRLMALLAPLRLVALKKCARVYLFALMLCVALRLDLGL